MQVSPGSSLERGHGYKARHSQSGGERPRIRLFVDAQPREGRGWLQASAEEEAAADA